METQRSQTLQLKKHGDFDCPLRTKQKKTSAKRKIFSRLLFATAISSVAMLFTNCTNRGKLIRKSTAPHFKNWVCNYNERANPQDLVKFDLIVLDADSHPDLRLLKTNNALLIGYLSLGEVGDYRWYWPEIKDKPWVLAKNPTWDSRMIDVRSKEWQNMVLNKIIPRILQDGFNGLFLDTIDNAEYLEKYHPQQTLPGSEAAMVQLIKRIRTTFPGIYLIVNRGFSLTEKIAASVDAIVAESLFSEVNFDKNTVQLRSIADISPIIKKLSRAANRFHLQILTLDYFDKQKPENIDKLITSARQNGFVPYISTVNLQTTYMFTLGKQKESK